ncbi:MULTISPECIES: SDR family NAD(P)-dependent oxidoreductase [Serratia]|uniref:SDR family NAD(P)-dependent oxidoreductase n=2 Tax=Bacteria TaxID=2 RepID=UPI0013D90637|nr:SDR family oxidoreductase [Serratia marcescens]
MVANNTKRLKGKVTLVTGGSRGIGRAIVERLAAEGVNFIGVHYGTQPLAADQVVNRVEELGAQAVALHADFRAGGQGVGWELWGAFSDVAKKHTGHDGVDILVNCAGIAPLAPLSATTEALYDEVLSINLASTFFLTQAAAPHIREGGRIINFSSALTRIAAPTRPVYAASKGAINALTLALAAEFGPHNITVNGVAPGVIDTDMNGGWLNEPEARRQAEELSVFSRVGHADDVASLVAFLVSPDSRWAKGQVIDVSGGSRL